MSKRDSIKHQYTYEKQPSRAYLVPMANKHATEHQDKESGEALSDFLTSCPDMPKDEKDWLCQHYLRVHGINNTDTQKLTPGGD